MKILIVCFTALAFTACNNGAETIAEKKDSLTADKNIPDLNQINEKTCYAYYSLKDTITLYLLKNENTVTGSLTINRFGKDKNNGTFTGIMTGDTLIAEYTFMSEGLKSVREIAFLKRKNTMVEGYGEVEDKNGKMVFKKIDKLKFIEGETLLLVSCSG